MHPDDPTWLYQASGDSANTREMLEEHLTWNYRHPSEFTSWTSSLLCALRHAMRKLYHWKEAESDVYIAVLDTANLAMPVWAAPALFDAYGIQRRPSRLERHYYHGEYLVRGGIRSTETAFRVASLERLREEGLHELLPELFGPGADRASPSLACRIRDDRDGLCWPNRFSRASARLTRRGMQLSRKLGECFAEEGRGRAFVFPVAVAFLALRRWDLLFTSVYAGSMELEDEILGELQALEVPDGLGGEEDFSGLSDALWRYKPEEAVLFRRLCQRLVDRSRAERSNDGEHHGQVDDPAAFMSHLSSEFSFTRNTQNNRAHQSFS